MTGKNDQYNPEEAARRRDEVIRRMANTPPQPRAKSPSRQSGNSLRVVNREIESQLVGVGLPDSGTGLAKGRVLIGFRVKSFEALLGPYLRSVVHRFV